MYPNQNRYEGQCKGKLKHGEGCFTWHADGSRLAGTFADDSIVGDAERVWSDGSKYVGKWAAFDLEKHSFLEDGPGVWHGASGEKYEGEFLNGLKHGEGT